MNTRKVSLLCTNETVKCPVEQLTGGKRDNLNKSLSEVSCLGSRSDQQVSIIKRILIHHKIKKTQSDR